MNLHEVEIVNFRSIKLAKISFEPRCRILVGINESGKSNVLRALSLISLDQKISNEDIRQPLPDEDPIANARVRFVFRLTKDDHADLYEHALEEVAVKELKTPVMLVGKDKVSLREFLLTRSEGLHTVDLKTKKRSETYWAITDNYKVASNWMKPAPACPADYEVEYGHRAGKQHLKQLKLLYKPDFPDVPPEHLVPATAIDMNHVAGDWITDRLAETLPKVVIWKYDDSHLLPPSIPMDAFSDNPDSCLPLKSMFTLAGVTNIGEALKTARASSSSALRNLLSRVANHATTHFKSVWKEYQDVRFGLDPNGSNIDANIVEKNHWQMSQRSDGFKRFMAFLLFVSANVRANKLSNLLLLIDEPDMGLHPSGIGFLRDELVDLSIGNFVCLSSHSIFMIDKKNIARHLIVKKEDEKTQIQTADTSNIVDEEVLLKALNYSVFEVLKKDNIVFEGWRDKKLFTVALSRLPAGSAQALKSVKTKSAQIGLCHAEGVKGIKNVAAFLEMAARDCIILSDSDNVAREKQLEYRNSRGYGQWFIYSDVLATCNAQTGEDFVSEAKFRAALNGVIAANPSLSGEPTVAASHRLASVKSWLAQQSVTGDDSKKLLNDLKTAIFDDLQRADVADSYYEYLGALNSKLA